jgi:hypothetical protein
MEQAGSSRKSPELDKGHFRALLKFNVLDKSDQPTAESAHNIKNTVKERINKEGKSKKEKTAFWLVSKTHVFCFIVLSCMSNPAACYLEHRNILEVRVMPLVPIRSFCYDHSCRLIKTLFVESGGAPSVTEQHVRG